MQDAACFDVSVMNGSDERACEAVRKIKKRKLPLQQNMRTRSKRRPYQGRGEYNATAGPQAQHQKLNMAMATAASIASKERFARLHFNRGFHSKSTPGSLLN
jgi:hypothetical protein